MKIIAATSLHAYKASIFYDSSMGNTCSTQLPMNRVGPYPLALVSVTSWSPGMPAYDLGSTMNSLAKHKCVLQHCNQ